MIRGLICAVFMVAIGGALGVSCADKLRDKQRTCAEIEHLIDRLSFYIGVRGDDVYEISRQLRDDGFVYLRFIGALPTEYDSYSDFRSEWRKAVSSVAKIDREERELLLKIGDILGKSDASGQLSALDSISEELRWIGAMRSEDSEKKGRLYRSVGVLFGIMAAIIVI